MTTVRVFAYIFGALFVLAALLVALLGIGLLVGGAGVSSSGASAGELGSLLGGFGAIIGTFGVFVVVGAVVLGLLAWFWFWAGNALGRGSTVARVLVTVVFALDICSGVFGLAWSIAVVQFDGGASLMLNLVFLALPILLLTLLWAPESARRHFAPVPAYPMAPPWGSTPVALPGPAPSMPYSQPVAQLPTAAPGWPLDASTDRMRPERGPAPRCRRCGTETERHWVHCGHCGDRLPAVGV